MLNNCHWQDYKLTLFLDLSKLKLARKWKGRNSRPIVNGLNLVKCNVFMTCPLFFPIFNEWLARLLPLLFWTDAISRWFASGVERYKLWNPRMREDRHCWTDRLWQIISWRVAMAASWAHRGYYAYWRCWHQPDRFVNWNVCCLEVMCNVLLRKELDWFKSRQSLYSVTTLVHG